MSGNWTKEQLFSFLEEIRLLSVADESTNPDDDDISDDTDDE